MARQVYPLNSLRAFEASARHLSFVKAAEELYVTPAAVSHQVKKLEEYVGVQLFRRLPRGLLLAEPGQVLMHDLREVFLQLDVAMERLKKTDKAGPLTISVAPVFAVKWLAPRLEKFSIRCPDIDVRVSSSLGVIDFQSDGFDAAIRFGRGHYAGLDSIALFTEHVTPMCSPRLADEQHPLREPNDLKHYTLLHDDSMAYDPEAPDWSTWLETAGANVVDVSRGSHFSHPDHALQATIDGTGVMLGWLNMAAGDLSAKRLIRPFDLVLPMGSTFYLVYPKAYANRTKLAEFREWIVEETTAYLQ